ncbi:phage tail tape measure C-terminal domain-containing protein [Tardiphaga sp.]|uniref:phage tail tape measure C-terminal domain-containing protein n=1 Tax=Tardiphaga sp. TaxID=1926292 RepID=UPI002637C397|nr:phage tail tape measure C-terminal domain-containing protein [Tardiphaga sp.]MDB5620508.1 phage tail tape measure protein [Tardiphaga sp.]
MAGDIAALGISVDSSQAKSATADLRGLATAANSAEQASAKLSQSGTKAATATGAMEAAAKRAGISTAEMQARTDAFNASSNKMAIASQSAQKALGGLSAQSKQGANDNANLGKSADATTSSLDKLASRFTRGLIAGAAITAIKEIATYVWNLNSALAATGDTAQRVGVGGQQFQGLQTAAAYKGVNNDSFNASMLAFNAQVDLAKHGLGDLQTLLRSNGKTVGDTATTFGIVADLVRNAGSEAQKFSILQQAGLPATREYVKLMEQGGDSITRQSLAASKLRDSQLEDAQRLDERWQKLWVDFAQWGKKAALDVGEGIKNIPTPFAHQGTWLGAKLQGMGIDRPEDPNSARNQGLNALRSGMGTQLGASSANGIYNATGAFGKAPEEKKTDDNALTKMRLANDNARLSQLGQLATITDIVTQKQNELNIAGRSGYGVTGEQAKAIVNLTRASAEWSQISAQAQIGVFNLGDATKQAGHELQSWIDRKLLDPNNPLQMAAAQEVLARRLRDTADAASVAGSKLPGLQQAMNDATNANKMMDQFATSSFGSITTGLTDIFDGTKTAASGFADLGKTVMRSLEEMLVKAYIVVPLFKALTGGLTGIGSMFGFSEGGLVPSRGFASGGYTGSGGKYQPAGIVHAGEFVFSAAATSRAGVANLNAMHQNLRGYDGGGYVTPSRTSLPDYRPSNSNSGPSPISVVVNNNGSPVSAHVQEVADGRGGRKIEVTLDEVTAANLSKPGSATRGAMANSFGAKTKTVRR